MVSSSIENPVRREEAGCKDRGGDRANYRVYLPGGGETDVVGGEGAGAHDCGARGGDVPIEAALNPRDAHGEGEANL